MTNHSSNHFNKYFFYYLLFLTISSVFFISENYLLHTNNSMAEWVINYQGGFGRRGLLGELFLQISLLTEVGLKDIILYFLYLVFGVYYLSVYFFFKEIDLKPIFIIAIFSPLFLIFPLAELEALGRKDILIPIFFIFFAYLYQRFEFYKLVLSLTIIYTILLLTHEISIFYLPFFYFIILFKLNKIKLLNFVILLLMSVYFLFLIFLLSDSAHSNQEIDQMCKKLLNSFSTECGLGASVLNRTLMTNIKELGNINITHILRALWIFFLGSFALFLSLKNSQYKNEKLTFWSKKISFHLIFLIIFFPTLIPFLIAVDWGRWFNLSYTMSILFYFFCIKNNLIYLAESNFIKYIENISKKKLLYFFIIFILCFTWNPKAVYHEDIGSVPIYRMISKIIKYSTK
jgi:hypothetical protein